jgi:hypothetical protein
MEFKLGEWLVACDRCGFKRYASQVVRTWDGLYVCSPSIKPGCFETRHPLDFQRAVKDDTSVEFVRDRPTDVYITVPDIDCSLVTPIFRNRTYIELATTDLQIDSVIISPGGIVTVPTGITITVRCSLEIR